MKLRLLFSSTAALLLLTVFSYGQLDPLRDDIPDQFFFTMVPSAGTRTCLPNAFAKVALTNIGAVERMRVEVHALPPNTNFDFFVTQIPVAPFGLSWYQGDIETDFQGNGFQTFLGRFNIETFIVAPGSTTAPVVHNQPPFPDAATNNAQPGPVHTFHLGLWFNSPADAVANGCPGATTPFNGEHNAGVQVLNTANFPNNAGPLSLLTP